MNTTASAEHTRTLTAALLAVGMAAVVGSALGFEHIGGYIPCKLCLEQRWLSCRRPCAGRSG